MQITIDKADVTFTSPETVDRFLENNPDSLQVLSTDRPLRLFAESIAVKNIEHEFRRILNHATSELLNSRTIEKIIRKYEKYPNSFYRVAKPYEAKK